MTIKSTQNKFAMYDPTEDYEEDEVTITKFDCRSQELKVLHLPKGYRSLIELNCSQNSLTWLPQMPASLEKLDCSINDIINLDGVLSLAKNLYYLNCGINYLTHLPILPNKLKKLRGDCIKNAIWPEVLPATLTYLDCSWNLLENLPFSLLVM
jgi:Leucine-rich repeat (LRR) protein